MSKFKVGDKAEFIKRYGFYAFGDVVEIISVWLEGDVVLVNGKQGKTSVPGDILKLVEPKLTKNQRITALEKEVAELRYFKELAQEMEDNSFHDLERIREIEGRLEHLEQAVQQYFAVPGESSTVDDKPKTPNQQRKEIIEKAKEFVDENGGDDYHFEIDEKEGQILAWKVVKRGVKTGLSTCHHNEVFNEDIGRAIAFGRAENLDVSEFEQAVQPTEVVEGMILEMNKRTLRATDKEYIYGETCQLKSHFAMIGKILNDTNAIY